MIRFIFESDIPSWSNPDVLKARLQKWQLAGFNAVMLQVDDGHGPTWDTPAWAVDSRVKHDALRMAVDEIHAHGMSAIPCVSLASFNPSFSHYAELRLKNFQFPFYDFWSGEFRNRRAQMLVDLQNVCDLDGLALDYLRTGREAIGEELPSREVLFQWMTQVRADISAGVPILSVHHSSYSSGVKEGVNLTLWGDSSLIDGAVLFDYSPIFPSGHAESLMKSSSLDVWPLIGNYDWTNNQAVARSGNDVSRIWRSVQREICPNGIGVYLGNLLTDEQVVSIRNTQRMVAGL